MAKIAAFAAALALGIGIGFSVGAMFGGEGDAPLRGLDGGSAAADSSRYDDSAREAPEVEGGRDDSRKGAREAAPSRTEEAAKSQAREDESTREELASEALPAGEGTIDGAVADGSGNPIAGVTIRAQGHDANEVRYSKSERGRGPPPQKSVEEQIKDYASTLRKQSATRAEAVTDATGRFRLTGLRDATYSLSTYADGWIFTPKGSGSGIRPNATVDFEGIAAVEVPTKVLLPDGRNAVKAALEIQPEATNSTWNELWEAKNPSLRFTPGRYKVRAVIKAKLCEENRWPDEVASPSVDLDARAGGAVPLELKLAPRLGIRGRVVPGPDFSLDQGKVVIGPVAQNQAPDLEALAGLESDEWVHRGKLDFAFLDLKPGRYAVGLVPSWSGPIIAHTVAEVVDSIVDVKLELGSVKGAGFLSAVVLGPGGDGIEQVNFTYSVQSPHSSNAGGMPSISRGRGRYFLVPDGELKKVLATESDPGRKIVVSVNTQRFGDLSRELTAGTRELTFQFQEPAYLDVIVAGYVGSGYEGRLRIFLDPTDGAQQFWYGNSDGQIQADGSARLGPRAPGEYNAVLSVTRGQQWERRVIASQTVKISSGDNRVLFSIPQLHRLTVSVPGSTGGSTNISGGQGRWEVAFLENGEAAFDDLPAGDYTVNYNGNDGEAQTTIKVPSQTSVVLKPKKPGEEAAKGN